jgi:uncharacterized protein (TIGR00369 family)
MVEPTGDRDFPPRAGIHDLLDVTIVEQDPDRVVLSLEVGPSVHQPFGILHGGVSALLAESAASFGAQLSAPPGHTVVGVELNANHLRAMRTGTLTATATPVRKGRRIHVWNIDLTDDHGRMICVSRCTIMVIPLSEE